MTSSHGDEPAAWQPCATGCTTRNRHTPGCADPCVCEQPQCGHCTGCQPRPAQQGSQVCAGCDRRALAALDDLPDLYEALLDPSTPGGRQPGPRGNDRPLPIRVGADTEHPGPTEQRQAIGRALAALVLTLHREYGITPPRVALHGALLAAVDDRTEAKFRAIDAGDRINATWPKNLVAGNPPIGGGKPLDPAKVRREAEKQTKTLLRKVIAADQRIARLTGTLDRTDPVHQHARHVAVHLTRLLARDDAGDTVTTLTGLARVARRLVAPSRPDTTTIGDCPTCGTPVRARLAQADDAVTCPGCQTTGPLDWWQDTVTGRTAEAATATSAQLAGWLSRRHQRVITRTTVRKWGSRKPELKTGALTADGEALYDVTATTAYAAELYDPATTKETA